MSTYLGVVPTCLDRALCLAMTPIGINDNCMIPPDTAARIGIAAISTFLCGTPQIKETGGLRLCLCTGCSANQAIFEAYRARMRPRDGRLIILKECLTEVCTSGCRLIGLDSSVPVAGFVHEIDRRGKGVLKQESKRLEAAISDQKFDAEDQSGLFAQTKAAIAAAHHHTSTVAEPSKAYIVHLSHAAALFPRLAIAVRPPSMNLDRTGVGAEEAEVELRRSWNSVLCAFASHVGLH